MRRADKLGARYVLILGESEIKAGKGTIRDMQIKTDRALAVDLSLPAQGLVDVIRGTSSQPSAVSHQAEGRAPGPKPEA